VRQLRRRTEKAARQYEVDAVESEKDRIKDWHAARAAHDARTDAEREQLTKMPFEEAQQWWADVDAEEEARKRSKEKTRMRWQTAVNKATWRSGQAGKKPEKIMYAWQAAGKKVVGQSRGNGALAGRERIVQSPPRLSHTLC
jgi:hypothetical protein